MADAGPTHPAAVPTVTPPDDVVLTARLVDRPMATAPVVARITTQDADSKEAPTWH